MRNWIGDVLTLVGTDCHERGEPLLSALCVQKDGTIGDGYGVALVKINGGDAPDDLDQQAAEERLRCYQHFGAVMPADGGRAQLTPEVTARRRKAAKQAKEDAPKVTCPKCNIVLAAMTATATTATSEPARQVGASHRCASPATTVTNTAVAAHAIHGSQRAKPAPAIAPTRIATTTPTRRSSDGAVAVLAGEPHHDAEGRERRRRDRDLGHVHEPDRRGLDTHRDPEQRDDDVLPVVHADPQPSPRRPHRRRSSAASTRSRNATRRWRPSSRRASQPPATAPTMNPATATSPATPIPLWRRGPRRRGSATR